MKTVKYIFLILIISLFSSCEEYLDLAPEVDISESDVYQNYLSVQGYLDNCYVALPDYHVAIGLRYEGSGWAHLACISDEAVTSAYSTNLVTRFSKGVWYDQTPITKDNPGLLEVGIDIHAIFVANKIGNTNAIGAGYYAQRIANQLIERVPSLTVITEKEKKVILGQAYFMRAYYFFEIIKRWGGMPLVDKAFTTSDVLDLSRESYSACTEWLITDLDKAIELLPNEWDDANVGRVDKAAALALKSMTALYAASPLMQNDNTVTVAQEYNQDWCKLAAQYAQETLDFIDAERPSAQLIDGRAMDSAAVAANYNNVFYHYPNFVSRTSLFATNNAGRGQKGNLTKFYLNERTSGNSGNAGGQSTGPSQNVVDMYEMADGTKFDWNNPAHKANPFQNRDPRLYTNLIYPGCEFGVVGKAVNREDGTTPDAQGAPYFLETWLGGSDKSTTNMQRNCEGGYLCTKWWWPTANAESGGWNDNFFNAVHIRTAQVWLDYAEAVNEFSTDPKQAPAGYKYSAVEAINKVRNRVGMVDVLPDFTTSKEIFRERIRNERAVELMFEHHRWFDIRRWMIAEDVFSPAYPIQKIRAEVVDRKGTTDQTQWDFTYSPEDVTKSVGVHVFENKHYWYPIDYETMTQMYNMKQNPGW